MTDTKAEPSPGVGGGSLERRNQLEAEDRNDGVEVRWAALSGLIRRAYMENWSALTLPLMGYPA